MEHIWGSEQREERREGISTDDIRTQFTYNIADCKGMQMSWLIYHIKCFFVLDRVVCIFACCLLTRSRRCRLYGILIYTRLMSQ